MAAKSRANPAADRPVPGHSQSVGRDDDEQTKSAIKKGRALPIDRLVHERLRLGILSALAVNDLLSFNDLKQLLKTTDGNLSVHARKLEQADYIICKKSFEGRVPRTEYRLAPSGRRALEKYLGHMEALIKAVKTQG
jgi:DNA-binding MarR family transcriptional regulator